MPQPVSGIAAPAWSPALAHTEPGELQCLGKVGREVPGRALAGLGLMRLFSQQKAQGEEHKTHSKGTAEGSRGFCHGRSPALSQVAKEGENLHTQPLMGSSPGTGAIPVPGKSPENGRNHCRAPRAPRGDPTGGFVFAGELPVLLTR